jgi:CheY-like chemotaxis protein
VRQAAGFAQARGLLAQESFDLVTLDIMMPEIDGLAALAWIKEHYPNLGVIMATAVERMDAVIEALRLGAYDYLVKPFDYKLISVQIARALERQRLLAENRAYQAQLETKVEAQTRQLRDAYARLERQVRELEGRDRLLRAQLTGATLEEACREILGVCAQVLAISTAVLYRPDAQVGQLSMAAALGVSQPGQLESTETLASLAPPPLQVADELAAQAFRQARPQQHAAGWAAVPLIYQKIVLGVLAVEGMDAQEETSNALWALAREAALVLWAAQITEDLRSGNLQVDALLEME